MVDAQRPGPALRRARGAPAPAARGGVRPARASPTSSTSARSPAAASGVGGGVYQLTKHGVGAFSESLRQEVTAAARARVADRAGRGRHRAHLAPAARDPRAAHVRPRRRAAARRRTSPTRSPTSSRARGTWRSTRCSSARPSRCAESALDRAPRPRHHEPHSADLLTGRVARLLVRGVVVERVALVGHLPLAVPALRGPEQRGARLRAGLRLARGQQRRPRLRAGVVAGALGGRVVR